MKKIINAPEGVVEDYIAGLVAASPHLSRVNGWPVVVRSPKGSKTDERVALISGGGSGHEPAHAGYVGRGMLDAAVLGPVFTSPSVDAVHAAIRAVATSAGVVLIVKNYTGDRLNFGLAAELARADGIRVEMIVVADDAALGDVSRAGRRGLTGTVLVHKIVGAAAERGWSIERILDAANGFLRGVATTGVALGPCHVPGAGSPNFELGADEVEWGLGIHGEAGSERGTLVSSEQVTARLVDSVVQDRHLSSDEDVVAMINGLGGTPDLELRILQGDVLRQLSERGLRVRMTWAGSFLTSLDMPGVSVTVARVDETTLALLSDEAHVLAFPRATDLLDPDRVMTVPGPEHPAVDAGTCTRTVSSVGEVADVVGAIAAAVTDAEEHLTELDRTVGDGDLGINLARAARALRTAEDELRAQPDVARYLTAIAQLLRREVGGTSGPLYSLLVLSMAERLRGIDAPRAGDWGAALRAGVARVREIGGAAPGDSTMVDALQPAVDAMSFDQGVGYQLSALAAAARAGAESTAALTPALGRSSYVGVRAVGVPDPGAIAIAIQFEAAAAAVTGER